MMGPLARIFGILFAVCAVIYAIGYIAVFSMQNTGLAWLLMPVGFGLGIFFILFIVMFILKR